MNVFLLDVFVLVILILLGPAPDRTSGDIPRWAADQS